jgi:hypothetical protein
MATETRFETTETGRLMLGSTDIGQVLTLFQTARTIAEVSALFDLTKDMATADAETKAQHARLARTVGNLVMHCRASGFLR